MISTIPDDVNSNRLINPNYNVGSKHQIEENQENQEKQERNMMKMKIQRKLENEAFELYTPKWNDSILVLRQNIMMQDLNRLLMKYQFIEIGGKVIHTMKFLMCEVSDEFINKFLYYL